MLILNNANWHYCPANSSQWLYNSKNPVGTLINMLSRKVLLGPRSFSNHLPPAFMEFLLCLPGGDMIYTLILFWETCAVSPFFSFFAFGFRESYHSFCFSILQYPH